jgi:hypothetical protein
VDMIGKLAASDAQRDAIHVAIAPVVAACDLGPGAHVGFLSDGRVGWCEHPIGIVDPYLNHFVKADQRFYLFLYPNTVTGMRHHWSHPAFECEQQTDRVSESRSWLEALAHRMGLTFDALMEHADEFLEYGEPICQMDSERWRNCFYEGDTTEEFWKHYEAETGKTVGDRTAVPFTGSC